MSNLRTLRTLALTAALGACLLSPLAQADVPDAEDGVPDLSGVWVMKNVTTGVAQVPVVGDVITISRGVLLVDITQFGQRLTLTERMCRVDVRTKPDAVRTIIPKRFADAVSGEVRRARLRRDAQGVLRFEAPRHVAVHGAELTEPRVDALPTDAGDPRILDPDADGKPGLTVLVEGLIEGALYVVQRGWTVLSGTVEGRDRITGRVRWGSEQVVVDATNALLTDPPAMRPHRNGRLSRFEMVRVPAGITCPAVLAKGNRLFERHSASR